jgi:eukaryotic-like serine/threonine-protein kinase
MKKICPKCNATYKSAASFCPVDGMRLVSTDDPLIGHCVDDRFRVLSRLGSGGMARVYLADDSEFGAQVALKILSPRLTRDNISRERFFRESMVAQRLDHPNVIKVWELGQSADGLLYIVMEYLRGGSLADQLSKTRLPVLDGLQIAMAVARGLAHAHELDIVHRDVKPENVMFTSHTARERQTKLLDFGLAWMGGASRLTATGQVFGTPEYLSPEQAVGDPVTPLADLYALGVMIYELVTGEVPFKGSALKVMRSHVEREPRPPSKVAGFLRYPRVLDDIIIKLLSKRPLDRYRDAHHLLEDLQRVEHEMQRCEIHAVAARRSPPPVTGTIERCQSMTTAPTQVAEIARRLETLRGRLAQISRPPDWVREAERLLREKAHAVADSDAQLRDDKSARLKQGDAKRRQREQIGRALDVLAADESRQRREVERLEGQLATTEAQLGATRAGGHRANPQLEQRAGALADELGKRRARLDDLEFQLEQLRGRLGALSADLEHDTLASRRERRARTGALVRDMAEFEAEAARLERFLFGCGTCDIN